MSIKAPRKRPNVVPRGGKPPKSATAGANPIGSTITPPPPPPPKK